MDTLISLGLAVVIAGLLEALLHVWNWNKRPGYELRPPWTYVIGLGPILACYGCWMLYRGQIDAIFGLLVIVGACGLVVIGLYYYDHETGERVKCDVIGRGVPDNGDGPKLNT